jgi:hypothetical protein
VTDEEVALYGKKSEIDRRDGGGGHQAQGRRAGRCRHHLRPGNPPIHVLPLDRRAKNRLQRELSDGLKKEEAEFKHTLLTTIRAAALARNQYWTAAAWLLERKYPDEYGKADRRREDEGAGDTPRIVLGVVAKPVQEKLDLSFDEDDEAPRSSRPDLYSSDGESR